MANSTANANITVSHGGNGTRDSDGDLIWQQPVSVRSHSMQGFSQFDRGTLSATQDDLDLTTLNLDGSGAKDLTGLYGFILLEYVSGSGSVAVAAGTTNGAAWFQKGTLGGATTQTRMMLQSMTTTALVTASLKTLDLTVTGTIVYTMTVYAGSST